MMPFAHRLQLLGLKLRDAGLFSRGRALTLSAALLVAVTGCHQKDQWHATNLTGSAFPKLGFTMTRADDGKVVTAADYRGKVILLYFGYTFCPDVCPLTVANTVQLLHRIGKQANDVRVLFVTVDPGRDTLPVLKQYTSAFAPQVDGLRGTPSQLAAFAKRYRIGYSVKKSQNPANYVVTHSSAVYVFDKKGNIRLLFSTLHDNNPKIDGYADDLRQLLDKPRRSGPLGWLKGIV